MNDLTNERREGGKSRRTERRVDRVKNGEEESRCSRQRRENNMKHSCMQKSGGDRQPTFHRRRSAFALLNRLSDSDEVCNNHCFIRWLRRPNAKTVSACLFAMIIRIKQSHYIVKDRLRKPFGHQELLIQCSFAKYKVKEASLDSPRK